MNYKLIHVCFNDHVLYREVYFDPLEARARAKQLVREKTWKINDDTFYFGDVHVKMYTLDMNVTSDV
jgi:hypothetical protein